MKPLKLVIDSPGCESSDGVCPYLGNPESSCSGRTGCWAGDGEDVENGFDTAVIDEDGEFPRFRRHVECPFGTDAIEITMRRVKAPKAVAESLE